MSDSMADRVTCKECDMWYPSAQVITEDTAARAFHVWLVDEARLEFENGQDREYWKIWFTCLEKHYDTMTEELVRDLLDEAQKFVDELTQRKNGVEYKHRRENARYVRHKALEHDLANATEFIEKMKGLVHKHQACKKTR